MSTCNPVLLPGTMAEANVAGTYYVCTVDAGPDKAQMYTVRFANGAQQQVHASFLRTRAPAAPVVVPAAVVNVSAPVVASTTAVASGPVFAVNEEVEANFRGNWFASKILKSLGNGKYKVKYLKSKTFGTVTEKKLRKKNIPQRIVTTTTVTKKTIMPPAPAVVGVNAPPVAPATIAVTAPPVAPAAVAVTAPPFAAVAVASNNIPVANAGYPTPHQKAPLTETPVANAGYPTPHQKAPLTETPVANAGYPTPHQKAPLTGNPVATASYPTPNAAITNSSQNATGIYPTIAPASNHPAPTPAPAVIPPPVPVAVSAPKKQKFKVVTTTTTKIVRGKKIVTTTTKKIPIQASGSPAIVPPPCTTAFRVVVPAGCVTGQMIRIVAPNGKQATVAIPAGVSPGQSFQVSMP